MEKLKLKKEEKEKNKKDQKESVKEEHLNGQLFPEMLKLSIIDLLIDGEDIVMSLIEIQ